MEILIGMVSPDGQVKYIRCEDRGTIFDVVPVLTRFYKSESRVSALVELGNLHALGPSPYGDYVMGGNDAIHCAALIRDLRHNADEEAARTIADKDIFLGATFPALLFEGGQWFLVHDGRFVRVNGVYDIPVAKREMNTFRLHIIRTSRHIGRMQKDEMAFDFRHWEDMVRQAETDDETYYVFSHKKLIATINPKPLPETL